MTCPFHFSVRNTTGEKLWSDCNTWQCVVKCCMWLSYEFVVSHLQETPTWLSMPILCISSHSFVPNLIIFFQLSYPLLLWRRDHLLPYWGCTSASFPQQPMYPRLTCPLYSASHLLMIFQPDPFIISYLLYLLQFSFPLLWILSQLNLSIETLLKLPPTSPASLSSTSLCQPHISFFLFIP